MRISLIVTTYNRPDALLVVLKSIQNQRIKPFEVIIADDGSDNSTKTLIDTFALTSGLSIIHSYQEDLGFRVSESRNKAISISKGEYIVLIDGDMVLHPEFINDHSLCAEEGFYLQGSRVLLNRKKTREVLSAQRFFFHVLGNGSKNRLNAIHSNFLSKIFSIRKSVLNGVRSCNMSFYRKDCININGFNSEFIGWGREDSDFVARLFNNGIGRKTLKFSAIQFHLWHDESNRKTLLANDKLLQKTIDENLNWCDGGVNKFL